MKWFRRKTPPYVQAVLDYVNAHDDWTIGASGIRRPNVPFAVWINDGPRYCVPHIGTPKPFPRRHRRALYKAAMDAAAKTIRNATPVKGSE